MLERKHRQFAAQVVVEQQNMKRDSVVSFCMDSTSIGDKQFLIQYLILPMSRRPLFYSLGTKVSTQEEYARCAMAAVVTLQEQGIIVGTICTDGLKAQTHAVDDDYKGFLFLYCFSFS
jgi:hypothetical protein